MSHHPAKDSVRPESGAGPGPVHAALHVVDARLGQTPRRRRAMMVPATGRGGHDPLLLSGDIGETVATALDAAGGKNLEILGADVAGQCLQRGLVDEILVYVLPVLLGDSIRFSSPGLERTDPEPLGSTRSGDATILRFRVRKRADEVDG